MKKNHGICLECAKDKYLKNFIKKSEKHYMECTICKKNEECIVVENNETLKDLVRALIRFHYPEYVYNHHWGGLWDASNLFLDDNKIIESVESVEDSDDFLENLIGTIDTGEKINLYYGRIDGCGRGCYFYPVKELKSRMWTKFSELLLERNHYTIENEFIEVLSELTKFFESTLIKDKIFHRSRIGFNEKVLVDEENGINQILKEPYEKDDISAPKPKLATVGRANRAGVSYLYLASESRTAVAEIRSSPGHYVSVGKFKNNKDLRIADFTNIKLEYLVNSEEELETFRFLLEISEAFSTPVLPDEKNGYLLTHFIADVLRKLGFDGILYESAISEGYNGVFFNISDFDYIENSSMLVKVKTVKYTYEKVENCRHDFFDFYEEKLKPVNKV